MRSAGSGHGGARCGEIRVAALEERLVGQDRQTGRTAGRVGPGEGRRVEVGPDQALAGRGLLDLGDQRVAPGSVGLRERIGEAARRLVRQAGEQARQGQLRLAAREVLALDRADAGEDVVHAAAGVLVMWIRRSSAAWAAPLSIDWAAMPAPWRRSCARPATQERAGRTEDHGVAQRALDA